MSNTITPLHFDLLLNHPYVSYPYEFFTHNFLPYNLVNRVKVYCLARITDSKDVSDIHRGIFTNDTFIYQLEDQQNKPYWIFIVLKSLYDSKLFVRKEQNMYNWLRILVNELTASDFTIEDIHACIATYQNDRGISLANWMDYVKQPSIKAKLESFKLPYERNKGLIMKLSTDEVYSLTYNFLLLLFRTFPSALISAAHYGNVLFKGTVYAISLDEATVKVS